MQASSKPITLTTDFGSADGYVGVVKGAILCVAPYAQLVDLSHDVKPWDIAAADWLINNSYSCFPHETTHLVVVDPGVGTSRRSIVISGPAGNFVGPDNGVFSSIIKNCRNLRAYELNRNEYFRSPVSSTF